MIAAMLIEFPSLADLPGGPVVALVVGLLLVVAGRRLFWLAVGALGFLFGFELAQSLVGAESQGLATLLGIGAGVLGIVAAVFLQKLAIAIGGFLVGGFLTVSLFGGSVGEAGAAMGAAEALLFLVGGLVAAFLALWLFEGALVFISSVAGAYLVVGALTLDATLELVLFLVAVVVGIGIQLGLTGGRRRRVRDRSD